MQRNTILIGPGPGNDPKPNLGQWHSGFAQGQKKEVTFQELMKMARRRREGIILIMVVSVVMAFMLFLSQKPEYHAVSLVMIKEENGSNDLIQALLGSEQSLDLNTSKKDAVIFTSMPIAELVVGELVELKQEKPLEFFGDRPYHAPLVALFRRLAPFMDGFALSADETSRDNDTILRERALKLVERIRVRPVKDTNMLRVSVASPFADEAVLLTNTLCRVYREADIARNSEKYSQANSFIAKSIVEQTRKVDDAEKALSVFMENNEMYENSGNTRQLLEKLVDVDARYNAIRAEYNMVNNSLNFLENKLSENEKTISSQVAETVNARLGAIMDEMRTMESGYANLVMAKGANDPEAKAMRQQLDAVKARYRTLERSSIAGEIGYAGKARKFGFDMVAEKLRIERRLNELQFNAEEFAKIRGKYERQLATLPRKQQEYLQLERDRDVASKTYMALKQKYDETRIILGSEVGSVSIIGSAFQPFVPEKPSISMSLMLGFSFGTLLAIGYTLIAEARDRSVNDAGFLGEIGIRPLSIIPLVDADGMPLLSDTVPILPQAGRKLLGLVGSSSGVKKQDGGAVREDRMPLLVDNLDSPFTESIRILRTALLYAMARNRRHCFVISGTAMSEGKSTVAVNLAMSMALIGKKTLLLECDLRRPSLHKAFRCSKEVPGLSDCLLQGGITFAEPNIQETSVENLFFLGAGNATGRSNELLASMSMLELLTGLQERYDCILLDCPPLFLSDAAQLADWVDGIVLVARLGFTNRKMLSSIVSDPHLGAKLLGVALIASPGMGEDVPACYAYEPLQ